ncbi:MAG: hypothetical protein ACRDDY_19045 [Clostridium sp.]|uniref:hypothetical protein n=1 Tax=Clostridium sp. TaxID=1506 RepID=UPI003EE73EE4
MEINDILNGFNGSDCDDKGCNTNHHHNNCNNNCNNNTWLILLLLLAGGNGFNGGCGTSVNHGCGCGCNSCCCCCEKPKFKKVKQTVYYPEYNVMPRDPGYNNNIIWLILLLGLCGNNGFGCGNGNSCKC